MSKKTYIKVASGWIKEGTGKNGQPYSFISLAFEGKSEKSKYEVILRDKSTGNELSLAETGGTMNINKYKTEKGNPKLPDYTVQIAIDEE